MLRTIALVLVLGGCNGDGGTDSDTEPDTDPIVEDCDVDKDGFDAESCGGADCDDADATVAPGQVERLGDDIDQDCNGKPNLGSLTSVQVDGDVLGTWSFNTDGTAFGGLARRSGGGADSYVANVVADAVADVKDYPGVSGNMTAAPFRVWDGADPFDVVASAEGSTVRLLTVFDRDGDSATQRLEVPPATWISGAVVDGEIQVAGCGGGSLTWGAFAGAEVSSATLDSGADRCAILSTGTDDTLLTGTVEVGPLNRWRVLEGSITDRAQLISNKSLSKIATQARSGQSLYAFTDVERIYVFDSRARGAILEGSGLISEMAVSGDGLDSYALAWVTTAGRLNVAWGTIDQDPTIITTLVPEPDTPVAVSLTTAALTVAWMEEGSWRIERALR